MVIERVDHAGKPTGERIKKGKEMFRMGTRKRNRRIKLNIHHPRFKDRHTGYLIYDNTTND
jgi:hypothetical protein